jgi:hypothetical protein
MSFPMTHSALLTFKVSGTMTNEAGEPEQFSFSLTAPRLTTTDDVRALDAAVQAAEKRGSQTPITDVLAERVTGWSGPVDDDKQPVPFSADNIRTLLNVTGLATLTYARYVSACSAQPR